MTIKICFVGLDNYPILNPKYSHERFGGESVQQVLIAKAFVDVGYDVSMIVHNYGQKGREVINGIRTWKKCKPNEGIPILRFMHPRITSILKALKNANADIYYQSCASILTGIVHRYCRKNKRKFIFRTAHDADCIPGQQLLKFWRDRKIYEYGLLRADVIAVQSTQQAMMIKQNYRLTSFLVNMAVEIPKNQETIVKDIDILWINNMRPFKRPELAIEIAKMLPDRSMTMIGGPSYGLGKFYKSVEESARKVNNLDFKGQIPYSRVNKYIARSKIFMNTSDWEGFPNSFLQSWIRGVPVISFFDPDKTISKFELGMVPNDLENMAECIDNLLNNKAERLDIMERAKSYAYDNHSPDVIAKRYIEIINNLK